MKKKWIVSGTLAAAMVVAGCESPTTATYNNSSGSLALSRDDGLLYAVDHDNEIMAVVSTKTHQKVANNIKLGKAPERVVVGPDDTIYVTNRGERTVSVIRKDDWSSEPRKVAVGVEPVGLAVSPDNKTLYVVNSTSLDSSEFGTLTAIDTATVQPTWELPVGEEPRAISLIAGNKALISLFKQGDVVQVDLTKPEVLKTGTTLYEKLNESRLSGSSPSPTPSAAITPAAAPATWARSPPPVW